MDAMDELRTQSRKAGLGFLLDRLERYGRRERYEMPFKITAGWGSFECYCEACAIQEVGMLRAIGIEDGDDIEGDIYCEKEARCEVCAKPLQFKLNHIGVAHEIEEYAAAPPRELTPRNAYVLCAIMTVMREQAYTEDFTSESYAAIIKIGMHLCELAAQDPQLELFP